jgi:Zn-dependent protease
MWETFLDVTAWILPVLIAVLLHEIAHGWVAEKFGDLTARVMGRITLNPIKHIDPFGTVIVPFLLWLGNAPFLFGSAKPVPVNFGRLRPLRLGMVAVALAGPGINVILAILMGLLLHIEAFITPEQAPWLYMNIYRCLMLNCVLAMFNMIPIPPLDGGRVVYALLPSTLQRFYGKLEHIGLVLLLLLLIVPTVLGYNVIQEWLMAPPIWLMENVMAFTGNSH